MKLSISKIFDSIQKMGGTGGTGGTTSTHAGSERPTTQKNGWDTVGQIALHADIKRSDVKLSHLSHHEKIDVGHRKPAWVLVVPRVPPVPPKKRQKLKSPEAFRRELCQGFTEKAVKAALIDAGMLIAGKDGKPSQNVRLPGLGAPKVYVIRYGNDDE